MRRRHVTNVAKEATKPVNILPVLPDGTHPLGTPHGSRHSGVNGFPLLLQLQMRPSLTASYRGIPFFSKMALLLPRLHLALVSTTKTPS